MYYMVGRWRRQAGVNLASRKTPANVAGGAFREARVCSRAATLKYLVSAND